MENRIVDSAEPRRDRPGGGQTALGGLEMSTLAKQLTFGKKRRKRRKRKLTNQQLRELVRLLRGRNCKKIGCNDRKMLKIVFYALGHLIKFKRRGGRFIAKIVRAQAARGKKPPVSLDLGSRRLSRDDVLRLYELLTGKCARNISKTVRTVVAKAFRALGYSPKWDFSAGKTCGLDLVPAQALKPAHVANNYGSGSGRP